MRSALVRRLVVEEINRSVRLEMILTRDEMRALKLLEARTSKLNEMLDWDVIKTLGIEALKSRMGRRIIIGLLKAVRFVTDLPNATFERIGAPVLTKAIDFLRSKGINIPFSAQDFSEFVRNTNLPYLTVTSMIDFLDKIDDSHGFGLRRSR